MSASLRARGFAVSCDRCPAVLRTWSPSALGALVYAAERGWSVRLGVRQGAGPDVCPACHHAARGGGR